MEKYNFAMAKRWIEGEGHSYVLIFTANVLHGSWIFAMNEIAQKCQLQKERFGATAPAPTKGRLGVRW